MSETPVITIVGIRDVTIPGKRITFSLSCQLTHAGTIITSGGARGTNTVAHKGALQTQGETICVLDRGLDYPYLIGDTNLRNWVTEDDMVILEYPSNIPGSKVVSPIRSRIISGLSCDVLVVEAAAKSGSLITVNLALE